MCSQPHSYYFLSAERLIAAPCKLLSNEQMKSPRLSQRVFVAALCVAQQPKLLEPKLCLCPPIPLVYAHFRIWYVLLIAEYNFCIDFDYRSHFCHNYPDIGRRPVSPPWQIVTNKNAISWPGQSTINGL